MLLYTDDPGPRPMDRDRARAQARTMLARPDRVWPHLLRAHGAVVGYAILAPFYSNEFGGDVLLVDEICVARAERRRGLGGRFLERIKAWAAARGVSHIELVVNHDNVRAASFYRRHGFAPLARTVLACDVEPSA